MYGNGNKQVVDWPEVGRNTCTSARVITALCDLIDGRAGAAGQSDFPDLFPRPMQSAELEAEELGLPTPYIWDIT
jgi:hypothetical protein